MNVITVENLIKSYDYYKKDKGIKGSIKNLFKRKKLTKNAVKGINFNVEQGSIVGFVGLNGAGKTTTLKILSGILKPTSGKVEILGYNPFDKDYKFLNKITMVMGNKSQLWWDIPAIETFELNRMIFNIDKKKYNEIVNELIDELGVRHLINVQVRKLSLGERMKMELIAALIHQPSILFLDEPTIGLDIISQQKIREFLKKYNRKHNTTVILTSHNFDDITDLCDKLILINDGEIIYNNTYEEFLNEYSNKKILKIKFNENISNINEIISDENIVKISEKEVQISINDNEVVDITQKVTTRFLKNLKDITIENIDIKEVIKGIYTNANKGSDE